MARQHVLLSSLILLLIASPTAAHDRIITSSSTNTAHSTRELRFYSNAGYLYRPSGDLLNSVTMRMLPPGSMVFRYSGLHRWAVRHARSQYRRAIRTAQKRGWYVRSENDDLNPLFRSHVERDFAGNHVNGAWWTRSWIFSFTPEQGGAPTKPYVHTYGKATTIKLGPLTITNELSIKLDYIGFFELNPNPVDQEESSRRVPVTIDVNPIRQQTTVGTDFRFAVKPYFRVGIPENGSWAEIIKSIAIRGLFEVRSDGKRVIEAEFAIKWDPQDGLAVTFDVALASW